MIKDPIDLMMNTNNDNNDFNNYIYNSQFYKSLPKNKKLEIFENLKPEPSNKEVLKEIIELKKSQPKQYMNIQEASEYTTLSVATINRLKNENKIGFIKKANRIIFDKDALDDWMKLNII